MSTEANGNVHPQPDGSQATVDVNSPPSPPQKAQLAQIDSADYVQRQNSDEPVSKSPLWEENQKVVAASQPNSNRVQEPSEHQAESSTRTVRVKVDELLLSQLRESNINQSDLSKIVETAKKAGPQNLHETQEGLSQEVMPNDQKSQEKIQPPEQIDFGLGQGQPNVQDAVNDEDESEDDDDDEEDEAQEKIMASGTGHFQEEQFLQEMANSKRVAEEFESNCQKNRTAVHYSHSNLQSQGDAEEGEDLPELAEKAAQNDQVVPRDDDEEENEVLESNQAFEEQPQTEGTENQSQVHASLNSQMMRVQGSQPDSNNSIQTQSAVYRANLRDSMPVQSDGVQSREPESSSPDQIKNAYEVSAKDLKGQEAALVSQPDSERTEHQEHEMLVQETESSNRPQEQSQPTESQAQASQDQQQYTQNEIFNSKKPPLRNIRLKATQNKVKKAQQSKKQGESEIKTREMVYAGIYGSSLVRQDKNVLKSLGIQNLSVNKLLQAQGQHSTSQTSKKRKASKLRVGSNKPNQVEHIVMNEEAAHTLNNSATFGSAADPSTKRGAFESDLGNSQEISSKPIVASLDQMLNQSRQPGSASIKIEQNQSKDFNTKKQELVKSLENTQPLDTLNEADTIMSPLAAHTNNNQGEGRQFETADNVKEVKLLQSEDESPPAGSVEYANDEREQLDLRVNSLSPSAALQDNQAPQLQQMTDPAQSHETAQEEFDQEQQAMKPMKKRRAKRKQGNVVNKCQYREFQLANGVVFKGLSSRKDPLTGDGELHLTNGSVYKGQIYRGQPHGQGDMIWVPEDQNPQIVNIGRQVNQLDQENDEESAYMPFQKTYKGNWQYGMMEGIGKYELSLGEFYYGYFKQNIPNGHGIRKFANGDLYDGEYVDGYQTGQGMFICQEQGWKYDGQWNMGRMTGQGTCQWRDGTMYHGQWQNCAKDGYGVLTYADGSRVECTFINEYPEGRGVKTFPDGSVYKGTFKQGLFHGQGKYRQPLDGSEYNGSWIRNEMRGQGVKKLKFGAIEIAGTFSNGQEVNGKGLKKWRKLIKGTGGARVTKQYEYFIYRGNLENSQIEGFGEFKWPDGRHYIGNFVNSQMHGHGKMTWFETVNVQGQQIKNTYKGEMYANVIHGRGVLKRSNGDTYDGEFENALFNGEGVYLWANKKLKYKGQFRNGHLHGFGVLHNYNGVYEGEFRKGLMSGKGLITFYNGDKYSGEFSNSQMTGYGCYTLADGTKMIGHFEDGVCNRHAKKVYTDGRIYIGEFKNDVENGKGLLIDGQKRIKGVWKDAVLQDELVKQDVNYENSIALTQYSVLSGGFEKPKKSPTPEVNSKPKPAKKPEAKADMGASMVQAKMDAIRGSQNNLEDIEEDERNAGIIFDEAQFDMEGREYFEIEYLSGDVYKGELQGEFRHGFGMFTYKEDGRKVIGIWKKNFMTTDEGEVHPLESLGELIPLSVMKYEGRAKKASSD